jgi:SSS family solute:Na+ symporter
MRGVADFLSANRSAGRYLLTIAGQMGGIGIVSVVAGWEVLSSAGIAPGWWSNLGLPVGIIILLTGWVYYRFRETRALTLAQFLEMRYSKKLRINAGIICWLSGILNFGIFPAVAARFFVYYCGLPDVFHPIPGLSFHMSTFIAVMGIDLGLALMFVLMGGQISVMITECLQGMFCTIAFVIIGISIILHFTWPQFMQALAMGSKDGASAINPFHTGKVEVFNVWYYIIGVVGNFYTYMSWQGSQGFNSSARSPHEQKMGGIIGNWRQVPQGLVFGLLGWITLIVMRLPEYASKAALITHAMSQIPNETIRGEMMFPIALSHVLPIGIKGLFGTIMLFISFTCHDTYMHSWGSIFIQDVYMPFRKTPMSPDEHIKLLRWSILGVAVFAFFFGIFYPPSMKIFLYFAATGTVWLGGSGALIVCGLYWKRGTTAGAYAALYTGAILGLVATMLDTIWKYYHNQQSFPVNTQYLWLIAMVVSLIVYIWTSVVTGRGKKDFDLERMLHRGKYAVDAVPIHDEYNGNKWLRIVGITEEFTKSDRFLAIFLIVWNALNFLWFIVFTVANLFYPISDRAWGLNWYVGTVIGAVLSIPCAIWFTIGGVIDIRALLKHLDTAVRDDSDDGRVLVHGEDGVPTGE